MVVEEDCARVVVGVRVERCAQFGAVRGVRGAAAARAAVGAVVDRAEGGGREGGEDARVLTDGGGDVPSVVSGEARTDQVVRVARVGPGAGGAAGRTAVAAGEAESAARLVGGRVVVQRLAGGLVLVEGPAGEVDRVGAATRATDLVFPAGVVGGRGDPEDVSEGDRVESLRGRCRLLCPGCGPVGHAGGSFRLRDRTGTAPGRRMLGGIEAAQESVSGAWRRRRAGSAERPRRRRSRHR